MVRETDSNLKMSLKRGWAERYAKRHKKPLPVTEEEVEMLWNEEMKEQKKEAEEMVKALKKRFEAKETPVKPEGPRKELVSEILEDELKEHVSRLSKSKGDCFITLFEIKCSDRMSRFLEHNIHIP